MTTVGFFEAKTKLSEVCEQVSKRREPVVITRRGRPIARIEPIGPGHGSSSVWSARRDWEKRSVHQISNNRKERKERRESDDF